MTRKPNETNANESMFPEDDPRITAYALGELSTEEATNLESELSANPEWQENIASVKETAGLLKQALAEEPMVGLTQAHRDRIESKIAETEESESAPAQPLTPGQKIAWIGVGIAASLFLLFSVAIPVLTENRVNKRYAADTNVWLDATGGSDLPRTGSYDRITLEDSLAARTYKSSPVDFADNDADGNTLSIGDDIATANRATIQRLNALGYSADNRNEYVQPADGVASRESHGRSRQDFFNADELLEEQQGWNAFLDADESAGYHLGRNFLVVRDSQPATTNNSGLALWGLNQTSEMREYFGLSQDGPARDPNVSYGYQAPFGPFNGDGSQLNPRIEVFAWEWRTDPSRFRDIDGDGVPDAIAPQESTTESYARIRENPFKSVSREPLSTFSIDVDTASYANARRFLNSGQLPPRDAVRIEEFINYFAYDYPQPSIDEPFSINVDVADCPWNRNHRLARIGLQGYEIPNDERPESNLVFLIDVSGSMNQPNKLPLLKQSMTMLVDQLDEYDRVAIVVYAGASGLVLDSITCDNRGAILDAIDNLQPGGGTNGAAGIELAYQIAADNFIKDGTNRVILATDGDFNVGVTSEDDLHRLIEKKAKTGVFLSVLGFGGGNYQDATLELLADKGNGNYAYIDTLREAEKVLVEQMGGTLVTIAKDVKIQVEFNPAIAAAYRLIGYENRMLAKEDFNDDTKDAGEIGAGHTVTALYEIVPAGNEPELADVDPLKYQLANPSPELIDNDELMTVKVRYKLPDEDTSTKLEHPVLDEGRSIEAASEDFRFAAAVASFGMILRNSNHRGEAIFDLVLDLAGSASGQHRSEDREGFVELVRQAQVLMQPVDAMGDADDQ